MNELSQYRCIRSQCGMAPLAWSSNALVCPNGHEFPFWPDTRVPVFATAEAGGSEYSISNAAEIHDNALRWLCATFRTEESTLRARLVGRLELESGMRVLVTGAGAGNDLPHIIAALNGRGEIFAQDLAAEMLLAAVRRHGAAGGDDLAIHFSISDATDLPFDDGYFDAAYHFGGINLYPDVAAGIAEMNRVVKEGGAVVFGDEGIAPWLVDTDYGRMLIENNPLYAMVPPLSRLPEQARDVQVSWELGNTFYVVRFRVSRNALEVDIDVPHAGRRGGSIRTRYFGRMEGVDPVLRDRIYAEAERRGVSRVALIESALRNLLEKP